MSNPWKEIRDAVWARAWGGGFTGPQLLVALRLVEHYPNIYPGEKTLARWTRLGVSTVRQVVAELDAARVLRITRNPGRVNQYEFLDRNGNPIVPGVPDIGPTPPGAGSPPRQELDHPPPGAGSPTPPGAGSEADPDLKQIKEAETEAASSPLPVVLRTIPEGYVPSEQLLSQAEQAGCPRAVFRAKLAELADGPIGGSRGILPHKLESYLLKCSTKWRTWAETERAKNPPKNTLLRNPGERTAAEALRNFK